MEETLDEIYGTGLWQVILAVLCNSLNFIEMYDLQANVLMMYKPDSIECNTTKNVKWIEPNQVDKVLRHQTHNLTMLAPKGTQCYGILPDHDNKLFTCDDWIYPTHTMRSNILIEHDLICDKDYYTSWFYVNYWIGMLIGLFICMSTDYFGRRSIFLCLTVVRLVSNFAMTMVNQIWMLFVLLFIRSFCFPSSNVCVTQVVELVPVKKRAIYGHLCFVGWAAGYVICPLIGFWLRDWRHVKYASLVFCAFHPLFFYFFVESPRWLLLKNKESKAVAVLKQITKFNNRKTAHLKYPKLESDARVMRKAVEDSNVKESLIDSIRQKHFIIMLALLTICRVSINSSYFGILTLTKFISDNLYTNIIFQGLMEVPSTFITYYMCDKIGRTNSTILTFSLSGVCLLTMIFIQEYNVAKLVVGMFGKLCIISSSNISIAYTTEVLPTSLRNSAYFFTSVCSAVVSAVTPFINEYLPNYGVMLCYSLPLIICGLVVKFLMPETRGAPMPETVADLKGFVRGKEHEWAKQKQKNLEIQIDNVECVD